MNNSYLAKAKLIIPDPQILSIVASKRARQLALGARPMVKCSSENHLDVALLEIAEQLLSYEFLSPEDIAAANAAAEAAAEAEEQAQAAAAAEAKEKARAAIAAADAAEAAANPFGDDDMDMDMDDMDTDMDVDAVESDEE